MNDTPSPELFWLTAVILMTAVMWVPYILNRLLEHGILAGIWDPQGITDTRYPWAKRMMSAHENAVENLVVFAPLALMVHLTGTTTELTVQAVMVYFYARLGHFIVFSFAAPILRVVLFLVGFACQAVLAATLLGWL